MPDYDDWQTYLKDSRTICKYGASCYQKNPEHHRTYKHPPKNMKIKRTTRDKRKHSPYGLCITKKNTEKTTPTTADGHDQKKNDTPMVKYDAAKKDNDTTPMTDNGHDQKKNDAAMVKHGAAKKDNDTTPTTDNVHDQKKNDQAMVKHDAAKKNNATVPKNMPHNESNENINVKIPDTFEYYDKKPNLDLYKDIFLVDMPEDFYRLYECLDDENQIDKLLSRVNLELIGPYDLLLGKLPILDDKELYLVHWRFFYDPPEFQAVLKKKGPSEFHIGYYRDNPNEKPVFVGSNDSAKDCRITPLASNIFAAVYFYLENEKKKSPFVAMACQKIMDKLNKAAEQNNFSIEKYNVTERRAQTVAKTLHGAGIVVPYNKKTQLGYRHLTETDATLEKIFAKLRKAESQADKDNALTELQPVITYANIAVDECDFGTGLEAGIDLFCSGLKELEPSALACLTSAYNLLNREVFSKIIKAHLKYRRPGAKLSLIDSK